LNNFAIRFFHQWVVSIDSVDPVQYTKCKKSPKYCLFSISNSFYL